MEWYRASASRLIEQFQTNLKNGLTDKQVIRNRKEYGKNSRDIKQVHSFFSTFFSQFKDPLTLLLFASGGVIYFAGSPFDAYIIFTLLGVNLLVGAIQDTRVSYLVDQLGKFQKRYALVIRNGSKKVIAEEKLVPGDLLVLQQGQHIAADARLVKAYGLRVNEAVVTGESKSVKKEVCNITQNLALFEQTNMVFCGSVVEQGYGHAIVVATGKAIMAEKFHESGQSVSADMPLQKDLAKLLQFILWMIVGICVSLFTIGVVTGKPVAQLLAALIALFICVVPQGLPTIMLLTLVSAAYRMARHRVLAKKLHAIEALGRTQVIIMDKTGTLTHNEVCVTDIVTKDGQYDLSGHGYVQEGTISFQGSPITEKNCPKDLYELLTAATLLNRSELYVDKKTKHYHVTGSTVEAALFCAAQKLGSKHESIGYAEVFEAPFSAQTRMHSAVYKKGSDYHVFVVGSPEVLVKKDAQFSQSAEQMFEKGLRTVAVAHKILSDFDPKKDVEDLIEELTVLGLCGMQDTLREDAAGLLKKLDAAGVEVVMSTGDNKHTAQKIAAQVGISDDRVFARVMPQEKVELVKAYMQKGYTVAMVGDGANDAPALTAAHVGIAFGNTANYAAQKAADIILLQDSFESILPGIEQGRHIFYSFKRVTTYFFMTNFSEVIVMLFSLAMGYPIPLLASQILWLNVVTDGCLDSALALEPQEPNLLRKGWLQEFTSLISKGLFLRVGYMSVYTAGWACALFVWYQSDLALARTLAMVTLTMCQWFGALNCRSWTHSLFSLRPFANRWFALVATVIPFLLYAIVSFESLQAIFKTVPLSGSQWLLTLSIGLGLLCIEELRKLTNN